MAATIQQFLQTLMETEGGSDLILTVGVPPQLRVYREMIPLNHPELTPEDTERLCFSLLTPSQVEQFKQEKEFDLAFAIKDVGRFRVNLFQQQGCYGLVARTIMETVPDFDSLRLPTVIQSFADLKAGLVLVTGPTGSGKSTTLAALIDYINNHRACHIVSIEDPIEYVHKPVLATINQREVGSDTVSYNEALRRVLRQAPDVILVGEVRDKDSAQAAITLAETGHLILATMHTRGAVSAINRMIDLFPPEQTQQMRSQLASSLMGVFWQQLLPAAGDRGLVLACEIMIVTAGIRALIMNGNTHEIISHLQTGKKYGMCSMDQALAELKAKQLIAPDYVGNNLLEFVQI